MQLYDTYSDDIYDEYLDSLHKGDKVLVKKKGHEFVMATVTSVNMNSGAIHCTPHGHFDELGHDEKTGAEIMLPTDTTKSQFDGCERRRALVARAKKAFDPKKLVKTKKIEDIETVVRILERR